MFTLWHISICRKIPMRKTHSKWQRKHILFIFVQVFLYVNFNSKHKPTSRLYFKYKRATLINKNILFQSPPPAVNTAPVSPPAFSYVPPLTTYHIPPIVAPSTEHAELATDPLANTTLIAEGVAQINLGAIAPNPATVTAHTSSVTATTTIPSIGEQYNTNSSTQLPPPLEPTSVPQTYSTSIQPPLPLPTSFGIASPSGTGNIAQLFASVPTPTATGSILESFAQPDGPPTSYYGQPAGKWSEWKRFLLEMFAGMENRQNL